MIRLRILFIFFLLYLTTEAKSFKESTIDNEYISQAIKVTPSRLVSEKETITIYIKNDDTQSINEFSKLYNPEKHHLTNFQFIQETDGDNVKKVTSKNPKTALETPRLEEYNEENKADKNTHATIIDSGEESRESKSDGSSTVSNDGESITISIKGQGKSGELIQAYENDLEVPKNIKTTEKYLKMDEFNKKINSDRLDNIMSPIPSRRSLIPNEDLLIDTKEKISNKSVEVLEADQDTIPKSDILSSTKSKDQSEVENTSEIPLVAPQLKQPPIISDEPIDNLSPVPTTSPVGLTKISHEETTNNGLVTQAPDQYKETDNLDKPGQIFTKERVIDDFNTNTYENAYAYTPPDVNSMTQQPLPQQPDFNSLYSQFNPASVHPARYRMPGGQSFGGYGAILPNFNLQNGQLQNIGPYNFVRRTRRFSSCHNCGHHEHKVYIK